MGTLQDQSEKLQQVEDDVEIIHKQISVGEKKLRGIDSCCCCCFADCFGPDEDAIKSQLKKQTERANVAEKTRQKAKQEAAKERQDMDLANKKNRNGAQARAAPVPKYKVKQEILTQEEEFEKHTNDIDKDLDKVEDLVSDIKQIAQQMGNELDNQNERIHILDANAHMEADRLVHVSNKTSKLS